MPGEFAMVSAVVAILCGGLFLRLCGVANETRRQQLNQARQAAEESAEDSDASGDHARHSTV